MSVSYNKLGDVAIAQGDLEAAARAYRDGLAIRSKLADSDPRNSQWQRDLSVSYNKLGDVAIAQGDLKAAARAFRNDLAIAIKLANNDPRNSEWQRDLYVSYWLLADLAEQSNQSKEARGYWQKAFDVLSGIDKRGLHVSPEDRRFLEQLRQKLK